MSDVLISDLALITALQDTDLLEIEQGVTPTNLSGKVPLGDLKRFLQIIGITTNTTSDTLALTDGGFVEMNVASANNLTVPPNSSVAFPIGAIINVHQRGTGQTTIEAGAGVTIRTPATLKIRAQYSTAVLVKRATDEWVLAGDLEAV